MEGGNNQSRDGGDGGVSASPGAIVDAGAIATDVRVAGFYVQPPGYSLPYLVNCPIPRAPITNLHDAQAWVLLNMHLTPDQLAWGIRFSAVDEVVVKMQKMMGYMYVAAADAKQVCAYLQDHWRSEAAAEHRRIFKDLVNPLHERNPTEVVSDLVRLVILEAHSLGSSSAEEKKSLMKDKLKFYIEVLMDCTSRKKFLGEVSDAGSYFDFVQACREWVMTNLPSTVCLTIDWGLRDEDLAPFKRLKQEADMIEKERREQEEKERHDREERERESKRERELEDHERRERERREREDRERRERERREREDRERRERERREREDRERERERESRERKERVEDHARERDFNRERDRDRDRALNGRWDRDRIERNLCGVYHGSRFAPICYNCNKDGHISRYCPGLLSSRGGASSSHGGAAATLDAPTDQTVLDQTALNQSAPGNHIVPGDQIVAGDQSTPGTQGDQAAASDHPAHDDETSSPGSQIVAGDQSAPGDQRAPGDQTTPVGQTQTDREQSALDRQTAPGGSTAQRIVFWCESI